MVAVKDPMKPKSITDTPEFLTSHFAAGVCENNVDGCERAAGPRFEMEINHLSQSEDALYLLDSDQLPGSFTDVLTSQCTIAQLLRMGAAVSKGDHLGVKESGSKRSEEKLALPHDRQGRFQPVPTDPPQGTAEPLNQDGGASPRVYLRNSEKPCTAAVREMSEKTGERSSPADTEIGEEGRGGGAPGTGAEILLQPVEDPTPEQVDVP
ncbi:hypothetical protein GRJ2_001556200 [Grus japonensis]|uniref:Uncharacterized protein n=1 Tax=Grus japonensis TaxID=30415 RepID=A0ABC9WZY4_GRUJA